MKKIKVGLIGCGTIGSSLARILTREFRSRAQLAYLCDQRTEKAERLLRRFAPQTRIVTIDRLIRGSDLILEAASAKVSTEIAEKALRQGKDVMIMSVGGLLASGKGAWPLYFRGQAPFPGSGRLWIPSGAVSGLDGLLAAREGKLRRVKLVTTKPASALREAPYFKRHKFPALKGKKVSRLFRGSASDAVRAFPQNINVAAVLALAGLGATRTEVEIWAAQNSRTNRHEVSIEGDFGRIHTLAENVPSAANPKTSTLAIFSAAATLRRIFSSVQIGT